MKQLTCAAVAAVILAAGCGSSDGPELVEVTGVVVDSGEPVADVVVEFRPEQGRPSYGRTDETGRFTAVYRPGSEGVVPGKSEVFVTREPPITEIQMDEHGSPIAPADGLTRESLARKYPQDLVVNADDGTASFDIELSFIN